MELKLQPDIRAAVEIDGVVTINFDNSMVYETIEGEELYFLIKTPDDSKQIKMKFIKVKQE